MGTLTELKSRVATDMVRSGLTTYIANAISDAIKHHESERFWFNTSRSLTFSTVAAQVAYGSAANARIPYLIKIDALFLTSGSTTYPLRKVLPADFQNAWGGGSDSGRPCEFTYIDDEIRLGPTADAVYTMRLHAHYKFADLEDADSNAWTTEASDLIREEAKKRVYLFPLRDQEGATFSQGLADQALMRLRAETSSRMGTGVIQGTEF